MFKLIAFDADDTLWDNENLFMDTKNQFVKLMENYATPKEIDSKLYDNHSQNLSYYGYGIKGFILSLLEVAVGLSNGKMNTDLMGRILQLGKDQTQKPVKLLKHVELTISNLSKVHELMIISKGDLLDQERKLEKSGIAQFFTHIEIVTEKNEATYQKVFAKYDCAPENFMMVGNSPRSDIWPVINLGGCAVYIPYQGTWAHELVKSPSANTSTYFEIGNMGDLPGLIMDIENNDIKFCVVTDDAKNITF